MPFIFNDGKKIRRHESYSISFFALFSSITYNAAAAAATHISKNETPGLVQPRHMPTRKHTCAHETHIIGDACATMDAARNSDATFALTRSSQWYSNALPDTDHFVLVVLSFIPLRSPASHAKVN